MDQKELDKYIERYLMGDSYAFDVIYQETQKSVYLSIYAIIKNRTIIEDMMQDTYMKAIQSIDYYSIGTNFKAWISRIARNTTLNFVKRRNREDILDPADRPDIFDSESNTNYLLDSALKILDGHEKDIFVYRIVLGYKFKKIGEILELPTGTVFWTFQKAIKKIKKEVM